MGVEEELAFGFNEKEREEGRLEGKNVRSRDGKEGRQEVRRD